MFCWRSRYWPRQYSPLKPHFVPEKNPEVTMYTECTKHQEHLPNIELRPILPSEQPQFVGGMDSTRCQVFHRDAGRCWIQCVSHLCEFGWMSFGWWTIHGAYYHTPFKGTSIFCLANSTSELRTYTVHSQLSLLFISTLIEVDLTGGINKGS